MRAGTTVISSFMLCTVQQRLLSSSDYICNTTVRDKKYIQKFGQEIGTEKTTWKSEMLI